MGKEGSFKIQHKNGGSWMERQIDFSVCRHGALLSPGAREGQDGKATISSDDVKNFDGSADGRFRENGCVFTFDLWTERSSVRASKIFAIACFEVGDDEGGELLHLRLAVLSLLGFRVDLQSAKCAASLGICSEHENSSLGNWSFHDLASHFAIMIYSW